jgi:hypothetical protein
VGVLNHAGASSIRQPPHFYFKEDNGLTIIVCRRDHWSLREHPFYPWDLLRER